MAKLLQPIPSLQTELLPRSSLETSWDPHYDFKKLAECPNVTVWTPAGCSVFSRRLQSRCKELNEVSIAIMTQASAPVPSHLAIPLASVSRSLALSGVSIQGCIVYFPGKEFHTWASLNSNLKLRIDADRGPRARRLPQADWVHKYLTSSRYLEGTSEGGKWLADEPGQA